MTIEEFNAAIFFFFEMTPEIGRIERGVPTVEWKNKQVGVFGLPRSGTTRSKTFQLVVLWDVFSAKKIGIMTSLCANWSKYHPALR